MKYILPLLFAFLLVFSLITMYFLLHVDQHVVSDQSLEPDEPTVISQAPVMVATDRVGSVFSGATQVNGDARITLLQVSRVTTFQPYHVRDMDPPQDYVKGLEIIMLVEHLVDKPHELFHIGPIVFTVDGNPVPIKVGVVAGGYGVLHEYEQARSLAMYQLPSVENPEDARVVKRFIRGLVPEGDRIDIEINVGYDDSLRFRFRNIPI